MKLQTSVLTMGLAAGLLSTSCMQQPPAPPAATTTATATDVHRFQVVVATEGDRGSVLFLVDTKEGATWLYRPPQGPAVNGFWSDIPRITYPPDFWQRAFSQLGSQQPSATTTAAAPAAPATSSDTTPAPSK